MYQIQYHSGASPGRWVDVKAEETITRTQAFVGAQTHAMLSEAVIVIKRLTGIDESYLRIVDENGVVCWLKGELVEDCNNE